MLRRLPDVSLSGQAVQGDMAEAFFMSYRALLSQIKLLTICWSCFFSRRLHFLCPSCLDKVSGFGLRLLRSIKVHNHITFVGPYFPHILLIVFLSDPGPFIVYPCHSLTHSLTDWRPCWRLNELTFVDGIKYLSDVDIEMKLRFSCQQLVTSGKAYNSCYSCQSWQQWIDS